VARLGNGGVQKTVEKNQVRPGGPGRRKKKKGPSRKRTPCNAGGEGPFRKEGAEKGVLGGGKRGIFLH